MKMENLNGTEALGAGTGYLLLFRGKEWDEGLSDEEVETTMGRVLGWFDGIAKSGKVKSGQALARTGKTISGRNGRVVIDGPFAESKEEVGGSLLLDVATLEEAMAIAKSYPALELGISIEVRPVLEECPVFKRVRERLRLSAAATF
jgi:hypothetical protein